MKNTTMSYFLVKNNSQGNLFYLGHYTIIKPNLIPLATLTQRNIKLGHISNVMGKMRPWKSRKNCLSQLRYGKNSEQNIDI